MHVEPEKMYVPQRVPQFYSAFSFMWGPMGGPNAADSPEGSWVPLGPISIAAVSVADSGFDSALPLFASLPEGHLDWKGCRAGSSPPATTTALFRGPLMYGALSRKEDTYLKDQVLVTGYT